MTTDEKLRWNVANSDNATVVELSRELLSARLLQQMHDSEINASVASFYDSAWTARIGDEMNGWQAEQHCRSEAEALEWLREKAKEIYGWEPK